ncbi:zinc finger protein, putative [Plasmodium vinckei brucechwatti]|uniref:Zinc finger protein, putative n=1 Tax=Plasmodium vinckei brucechwatti TaxID=119398 RepID=A0A6V7RX79_PLAVN|nr:zinc finger protein, putative [Plasmodium vinckei brucechwatti]
MNYLEASLNENIEISTDDNETEINAEVLGNKYINDNITNETDSVVGVSNKNSSFEQTNDEQEIQNEFSELSEEKNENSVDISSNPICNHRHILCSPENSEGKNTSNLEESEAELLPLKMEIENNNNICNLIYDEINDNTVNSVNDSSNNDKNSNNTMDCSDDHENNNIKMNNDSKDIIYTKCNICSDVMDKTILNDHLYAHMLACGRESNRKNFEHRKNIINLDAFALKDKKNNNNSDELLNNDIDENDKLSIIYNYNTNIEELKKNINRSLSRNKGNTNQIIRSSSNNNAIANNKSTSSGDINEIQKQKAILFIAPGNDSIIDNYLSLIKESFSTIFYNPDAPSSIKSNIVDNNLYHDINKDIYKNIVNSIYSMMNCLKASINKIKNIPDTCINNINNDIGIYVNKAMDCIMKEINNITKKNMSNTNTNETIDTEVLNKKLNKIYKKLHNIYKKINSALQNCQNSLTNINNSSKDTNPPPIACSGDINGTNNRSNRSNIVSNDNENNINISNDNNREDIFSNENINRNFINSSNVHHFNNSVNFYNHNSFNERRRVNDMNYLYSNLVHKYPYICENPLFSHFDNNTNNIWPIRRVTNTITHNIQSNNINTNTNSMNVPTINNANDMNSVNSTSNIDRNTWGNLANTYESFGIIDPRMNNNLLLVERTYNRHNINGYTSNNTINRSYNNNRNDRENYASGYNNDRHIRTTINRNNINCNNSINVSRTTLVNNIGTTNRNNNTTSYVFNGNNNDRTINYVIRNSNNHNISNNTDRMPHNYLGRNVIVEQVVTINHEDNGNVNTNTNLRVNNNILYNERVQHENINQNTYHSTVLKEKIDFLVVPFDIEKNKNNNLKLCSICYENYKHNEPLIFLPCTHNFHKECIIEWINKKLTCPICKIDIKSF